jgi:hypothetical protein
MALRPRKLYTSSIVLLSFLLGFALSWQIGGLRECVFGIVRWAALLFYLPVGFVLLTVLVRFVPYLVSPNLVVARRQDQITTLDLTGRPPENGLT